MNKKINTGLIALLMAITLIPQITFASWWSPISWFKKSTKPVEQPIVQVQQNNTPAKNTQKISDKKISENKISIKKVSNAEKKSTKEVDISNTPQVVITPTPLVWDVCKNIEGAQSIAPDGLYVDNGNCVPVSILTPTPPAPQFIYVQVPAEPVTVPPIEKVNPKVIELQNQINSYLQKISGQITELNLKIAIAESINSPVPKSTQVCQGTKTSNGCEVSSPIISYRIDVSTYFQMLIQLTERKNQLNIIFEKLQKGGIKGITDDDTKFLSTLVDNY